jgi:molybdate transport system ATP-binding protein
MNNLHIKIKNSHLNLSIDTSLPLSQGIVGVFGKSGAGKSTLLRVLAALEKTAIEKSNLDQAELKIHWQDKRIDKLPAEQNPCLLQTQQAQLFPNLTVLENLEFVLKYSNWAKQTPFTIEQVIQWCGIEHLLTQPSISLSGGEQQRVNLARSLLCGKPIILLDEPFSALDWNARTQLLSLLVQLQHDYKLHFVIVSHSLKELALCSQHILVIDNGELVQSGSTTKLIDKLTHASSNSEISSASKTDADAGFSNQTRFSTLTLTNPVALAEYHLTKWQLSDGDKNLVIYTKGSETTRSENKGSESAGSESKNLDNKSSKKLVTLDANRVSLSRQANLDTSMLNHLEANITDITHIEHLVLVTLNVQGQTLYAEISLLSFSNLNLQLGETVFAQFKAL